MSIHFSGKIDFFSPPDSTSSSLLSSCWWWKKVVLLQCDNDHWGVEVVQKPKGRNFEICVESGREISQFLHSDLFAKFAFFSFLSFSFLCSFAALTKSDKKVIGNGKHFVENGNELFIKNASKHLSGYYSCVVKFTNSGAKLETPHELINFVSVGEYRKFQLEQILTMKNLWTHAKEACVHTKN